MKFRPDPERVFRGLGLAICRRPGLWTALLIGANLALAVGIGSLGLDMSARSMLRQDDPILVTYYNFWRIFGRDDLIIVGLEAEDVFAPSFLDRLRQAHERIRAGVPHVARVVSLINARVVRADNGGIRVRRFLEDPPLAGSGSLRTQALANPLWRNLLVSTDGKAAFILVELDPYSDGSRENEVLSGFGNRAGPAPLSGPRIITSRENREIVAALRQTLAAPDLAGSRFFLAGETVVSQELTGSMLRDTRRFLGWAFLANFICLYLMFRDRMGVVLPLVVILLSLASAMGLMGYAGTALKLPSMILPTFLMVVGLADSVHLLTGFKKAYQRLGDRRAAIAETMGHNGVAVTATSLTTALGLLSFATAEVAPLAELGIFAAAGVLIALVNSLLLLPALVAICPSGFIRADSGWGGGAGFRRLAGTLARLTTGRPVLILVLTGAVAAGSLFGALRLDFSVDFLNWLPESHQVRRSTHWMDRHFGGTVALELVVGTDQENGLHDPLLLKNLDLLSGELESGAGLPGPAGKVSSVVDLLKEVNQALHHNSPDHYRIPDRGPLIAQEFLLLESYNPDDLARVIDPPRRRARLTTRHPWRPDFDYLAYAKGVEEAAARRLGPGAEITVTGAMSLLNRVLNAAVRSMTEGYLIAFVTISLAMILSLFSFSLGLASLIPNLAPILVVLGLMGWLGWPLDLSTLLIGSLALGLVVDDTIHFLHHFKRNFGQVGQVPEAVRMTLLSAGQAITVTSLVLVLGFLVFTLATMRNIVHFGWLTSLVIVLAWIADFLILPAVVAVLYRSRT